MVQGLRFSFQCSGGVDSISGGRAKIPHASRPKNWNIKQKQYCNRFNKDFRKWSTSKKKTKVGQWNGLSWEAANTEVVVTRCIPIKAGCRGVGDYKCMMTKPRTSDSSSNCMPLQLCCFGQVTSPLWASVFSSPNRDGRTRKCPSPLQLWNVMVRDNAQSPLLPSLIEPILPGRHRPPSLCLTGEATMSEERVPQARGTQSGSLGVWRLGPLYPNCPGRKFKSPGPQREWISQNLWWAFTSHSIRTCLVPTCTLLEKSDRALSSRQFSSAPVWVRSSENPVRLASCHIYRHGHRSSVSS